MQIFKWLSTPPECPNGLLRYFEKGSSWEGICSALTIVTAIKIFDLIVDLLFVMEIGDESFECFENLYMRTDEYYSIQVCSFSRKKKQIQGRQKKSLVENRDSIVIFRLKRNNGARLAFDAFFQYVLPDFFTELNDFL